MASTNGGPEQQKTPAIGVLAQYIKDLSFENPNVRKLLEGPGEQPALRVEVNVNATKGRVKDLTRLRDLLDELQELLATEA